MAKADTGGTDKALRQGKYAPYAMTLPGMLWLYLFFVIPLVTLLKIALSTKPNRNLPVYDLTWAWGNFSAAFGDYGEQPGDGTPTISHDDARRQISGKSLAFVDGLDQDPA
jgi:ABC-type sugar transport system permease subunit